MRVMTIQVGKWRLAKKHDVTFLDTTVKSGWSLVKPTWDLVMGSKQGVITWDQYKEGYRKILVNSWMTRRDEWLKFLKSDEIVALACYCKYKHEEGEETHCHRFLLVDFCRRLCKQLEVPFEYYGELTDEEPGKGESS